jgi:hypothetical protein
LAELVIATSGNESYTSVVTQRRLLWIVPLLLLLTPLAQACSLVSCIDRGIEVRRDFSVLVKHDGKPLKGVKVEIKTNLGSIISTGTTDSAGRATVTTLSPGEYWLSADLLGIGAAYHCFHVAQQPTAKAKRVMKYDWGDLAPAIRRVAGSVIDSQPGTGGTLLWNLSHPVKVPVARAALRLQNGITGEVFTATSGESGDFEFASIPNGTYVLHVEGGTGRAYDPTDVLVKVRADVARAAVVLSRQKTGCGGG